MENKSKSVNYLKQNIIINLELSSENFEIEATDLISQTVYSNTWSLENNIDYNLIFDFELFY